MSTQNTRWFQERKSKAHFSSDNEDVKKILTTWTQKTPQTQMENK